MLARTTQGWYEHCTIRTGMIYSMNAYKRSWSRVPVELSRPRDTVSDEMMTVCFYIRFDGFKRDSLALFSRGVRGLRDFETG